MDHAAKFLGMEGKTGAHAKDFGKLYVDDLPAALAYLERDVKLVAQVHGRILR